MAQRVLRVKTQCLLRDVVLRVKAQCLLKGVEGEGTTPLHSRRADIEREQRTYMQDGAREALRSL